jgi:ribosomal protein S18 acetylase RimI-like enzyme
MTVSVSVREAEVHALTLWVEPSCQALGDWVLRTVAEAPGLRLPRTNSCLAIGDPGLPLRAAVGSVNAFYDSLGRTPLVQVEAGSEIERAFLAAGWAGVPTEDTSFHVADHAEALAGCGSPGPVVTTLDDTRALAVLSLAGNEVGRVRGELNGEWLGIHGLQVEASRRRRGHARELMAGLLDAGTSAGASTVWLQVADDNRPALALYGGLGFRWHHACRYLTTPGPA